MPEEIADAVLDKVKHFTIGFGRAGETPAAKGSGVLVKHGELHGILTCAHVDKYLRDLKQPIGLVRFNRGLAQQFGTLDMGRIFSHVAGEEPWTQGDDDISFIRLPPGLVGNIAKIAFSLTPRGTSRSPSLTIARRSSRPTPSSG